MASLHGRCFTTPRPWCAADFEVHLANPLSFLCLSPFGLAIGRAVADEAELLTLAIDPDHRRKGHGAHLLTDYERTAVEKGASMSFLEVASDNRIAITLYHSAGYVQAGQRMGYYRRPDGSRCDAIVLRKELTARTVPQTPESS